MGYLCIVHSITNGDGLCSYIYIDGHDKIIDWEGQMHEVKDPWGAKLVGEQYVGPNLLGRLLMELREQKHLDYTFPPVFSISIASSSI